MPVSSSSLVVIPAFAGMTTEVEMGLSPSRQPFATPEKIGAAAPSIRRRPEYTPAWMQVVDVISPQAVYLNQIGETGTMRQRLYMKGDSNEHAQER